jgi:hypothetical protein
MYELRPESLSDEALRDPATLAALQDANRLEGRDVFDVNGQRLGRATRAFAEEGALARVDVTQPRRGGRLRRQGALARVDVTLSENARGVFDAPQDVVGVPSLWIGRVEADGIHLRKAAQEIVHPEGEIRPGDAKVGAKELPRKIR